MKTLLTCFVCDELVHCEPIISGFTPTPESAKDEKVGGAPIVRHPKCGPYSLAWALKFPKSNAGQYINRKIADTLIKQELI